MNYKIAKPCTQNWNEMALSDNGCFCMNCQKEVYDLTGGKTLPEASGNFCGRIYIETPAKTTSFKNLSWKQNPIKYILFTSLLLFTRNIKAQLLNQFYTVGYPTNKNQADTTNKNILIKGTLIDEKTKESIPFANITVSDSLTYQLGTTLTDIDGNYNIKLDKINIRGKSITIKATYTGYDSVIVKDIPIDSMKRLVLYIDPERRIGTNFAMGAIVQEVPGIFLMTPIQYLKMICSILNSIEKETLPIWSAINSKKSPSNIYFMASLKNKINGFIALKTDAAYLG